MNFFAEGYEKAKDTFKKVSDFFTAPATKEELNLIGQVMLSSIDEQFAVGGKPSWDPLSIATLTGIGRSAAGRKTRAKGFRSRHRGVIGSIHAGLGAAGKRILIDSGKYRASWQLRHEGSNFVSGGPDTAVAFSNSWIGRIHQFGSDGGRIPARPVQLQPVDLEQINMILLGDLDEALK